MYDVSFLVRSMYCLSDMIHPSPFGGKQYIVDHEHLTPELGVRIVDECIKINKALGYDMNTVEFAIKDGIPYALDFMNPIPDTEPGRISVEYFQWVVKTMADVAVEYALEEKHTLDIAAIREKVGLPAHDMVKSPVQDIIESSIGNDVEQEGKEGSGTE